METTYYITEFYKIHNPDRISGNLFWYKWLLDVPSLVKKYRDDYDHLFQKMKKKYGTDPRDEILVIIISYVYFSFPFPR